jgi:hypothetical protein
MRHRFISLCRGFPSHHTLMVTTLSLCMVNCLFGQGMLAVSQLPWCICLCACWVSLVGFSRLYIGVHSVADLAAGLVCGLLLTAFYITVEPHLDRYFVSDFFSKIIIYLISSHRSLKPNIVVGLNRMVAFCISWICVVYGVSNSSTSNNNIP